MLLWHNTVSRTQFYWFFNIFVPHPIEGVFILVLLICFYVLFDASSYLLLVQRALVHLGGPQWWMGMIVNVQRNATITLFVITLLL